MKLLLAISLLLFGFGPLSAQKELRETGDSGTTIPIHWKADIPGDFSFAKQWNYPIGVYKNIFGQLSCDGYCLPESDAMKDSLGKIYPDSMKAYYRLVDTSHLFHSISETGWCYEYAGTNYMKVKKIGDDSFFCYTLCNPATHCSLHWYISKKTCRAEIDLNSIVSGGSFVYPLSYGYLAIDTNYLKQGILKAVFDMHFEHLEDPSRPIYWRGSVYAVIESQK